MTLSYMIIYQSVAVISGALLIFSAIGAMIVYLVRNADKVKAIPENISEHMKDMEAKIEVALRKTDRMERDIVAVKEQLGIEIQNVKTAQERGFLEMQESHSLILQAVSGIANRVGAEEVVDMLKKNTTMISKRRSG